MISEITDLHAEFEELPHLHSILITVLDFIFVIHPGNFERNPSGWVYRPDNFVALTVRYKRANHVTFTFRDNVSEFHQLRHLPLEPAQHGYSRCYFDSVLQLDALLFYIRQAHDLYEQGHEREQQIKGILK
jgi:hypothetical protein